MALMYFKDEKSGPGKQWMGKAAVRKILEAKDQEIIAQNALANEYWQESMKRSLEISRLRRRIRLYLGVLIGDHILLALYWGSTFFNS